MAWLKYFHVNTMEIDSFLTTYFSKLLLLLDLPRLNVTL